MCKALEDLRNETREEERVNALRKFITKLGWPAEQAMSVLDIPQEERAKYLAKL